MDWSTDWCAPKEAAAYLGVSKATVLRWVKDGRLAASKLGHKTVRVSMASVERLLERNRQAE